jgi:hypothetical protein
MMVQLGQQLGTLNTARKFSRSRYSNCSFSFGGTPDLTGATEEYDGT